jgi:hypothetical protein
MVQLVVADADVDVNSVEIQVTAEEYFVYIYPMKECQNLTSGQDPDHMDEELDCPEHSHHSSPGLLNQENLILF